MENRFWDPQGKYKDVFLKEYKHWILEVSFRQHTPGCFIIFAKRQIEKIVDLRDEELIELRVVMTEMQNLLISIPELKPDRFNYMQLGNELHNLHFHGIPRYNSTRNFVGIEWIDENPKSLPIWKTTETDKEIVMKVKEEIQKRLA
jgi:diadenosine tetraphosphate (Ap4A) HIT family hydrolase